MKNNNLEIRNIYKQKQNIIQKMKKIDSTKKGKSFIKIP